MDIVFFGSPDFGLPALSAVMKSRHNIRLVVTRPDSRAGRGRGKKSTPVKEFCLRKGLKSIIETNDLNNDAFIDQLKRYPNSLFLVIGFKILPSEVLCIPEKGAVNLHASLLPRYRGAAPVNWAVVNGERETGNTVFFLDKGVDTGNIILQSPTIIKESETAGDLYERLSLMGRDDVLRALDMIEGGTVEPLPQDSRKACPAPKLRKKDGRIVWSEKALQLRNKVRGFNPYPGCFSELRGRRIKILKAENTGVLKTGFPGSIAWASAEEGLGINTGDYVLKIIELQPENKKKMTAKDFLLGSNLRQGEILE
ncbi:MAG: methionyl-tRNA formyltransferase [Fibrobacterota bacterium]